jgi:hypothetical protein
MDSLARAKDTIGRLRRERDRLDPVARGCVERYIDDVEPCLDALESAMRLADLDVLFEAIAESVGAFGDEIASIVVERHAAEADLLPELVALARVEREGFAEDARRLRGAAGLSPRARLALGALAVSLAAVRRPLRRAA